MRSRALIVWGFCGLFVAVFSAAVLTAQPRQCVIEVSLLAPATCPGPATVEVAAPKASSSEFLRLYRVSTYPVVSRWDRYSRDLFGPPALLVMAAVAGIDQLGDNPEAWERDWNGYGRRLGSRAGHATVQLSTQHGLAAILDRPTRYLPCTACQDNGQRLRHALSATLFDSTPSGRRALAVPRIAGTYAGELARATWTPGMPARDALLSGTISILASAIPNLAREFLGIGR